MKILITYPKSFLGIGLQRVLKDHFCVHVPDTSYEDSRKVCALIKKTKPGLIILQTPFSGGIQYNIQQPAALLTKNIQIQSNVISAAHQAGVKRLFFIASSCMYPKNLQRRLATKDLLTGPLETTSIAYATSKICGWQMCKAHNRQYKRRYITVIPSDLYGPFDVFNREGAHVVSALISRFHNAKMTKKPHVSVWGTGKPLRDFLYIEDFADALLYLIKKNIDCEEINIGSGRGYSIRKIADRIRRVIDYPGKLVFDNLKPDGAPMKVLDSAPMARLGWRPKTSLTLGLQKTYHWYKDFYQL